MHAPLLSLLALGVRIGPAASTSLSFQRLPPADTTLLHLRGGADVDLEEDDDDEQTGPRGLSKATGTLSANDTVPGSYARRYSRRYRNALAYLSYSSG